MPRIWLYVVPLFGALASCSRVLRVYRYETGFPARQASCAESLKLYWPYQNTPQSFEPVVTLRVSGGNEYSRVQAIRAAAAESGATGVMMARPWLEGLPSESADESWGVAIFTQADSAQVYSTCAGHAGREGSKPPSNEELKPTATQSSLVESSHSAPRLNSGR
jgi:hypothetical protein